ncbi:hypothetical protein N7540_005165 [Penicillium herquei]|nr:hypothetical protein N7540_005165 [Penicillium herquei]
MPKRKRAEDKQPVNNACDTQPISKPTLLSLPPEIRHMIWATVLNDPILIVTGSIWDSVKQRSVPHLKSVPLNQDFIKFPCRNYHHHQEKEGKQAIIKGIGALSWLRTNRQISTEVRSMMYNHLTLHMCDSRTWQSLLDEGPKKNLQMSKVYSVSFCHKLFIEHDLVDGFRFPNPETAKRLPHQRIYPGKAPVHTNPLCMARSRMGGKTLDSLMPALRVIQPRVHFSCRGGNDRPVIGEYKNGRPRKGQLYRPKVPSALIYQDEDPAVQEIAKVMAGKMPWLLLRGGPAKAVYPLAYLDAIEHDNGNKCRLCWCRNRSINAEAFPGALLAIALERELAIPLQPLDWECNGCKRFAYGTQPR